MGDVRGGVGGVGDRGVSAMGSRASENVLAEEEEGWGGGG